MKRLRVLQSWRAIGLLAALAAAVWLGLRGLPDGRLHVYFLDVGQGDAILLRTPEGHQILVDGGPTPGALFDQLGDLLPFWDRSLDLVILTHPDGDHAGGLLALPDRYAIGKAVDALATADDDKAATWINLLTGAGVTRVPAQRGIQLRAGDVLLTVLNPDAQRGVAEDSNAGSIVLRLDYGETSVLLTGDAPIETEDALLAAGLPLDADALKVAHHGSAGSTSARFLDAVSPDVAVIQVGADNTFGHPAPAVLDRLKGIHVWRTDENGRIELISDGVQMWVKPERKR